jgi:hypothetical protein
MLNLYRRHLSKFPHRSKGRKYRKCSCPIWCDGEIDGKRCGKSVGLRDWARAVKHVEKWETKPETVGSVSALRGCFDSYPGDCRARNPKESTITGYEKTLHHLERSSRRPGPASGASFQRAMQ